MAEHKIFSMAWAKMYPNWIRKVERKGRTQAELEEVLCWFTGHTPESLQESLATDITVGEFLADVPRLNPSRRLITGVVCGVRVEDIEDPQMQELRYIDKLVDELAKGKAMEKILRSE